MEKQIEYDFIIKPGGEVSNIRFEYQNVKKVEIDEEGNLVVETGFGELRHLKPASYQITEEGKTEVEARFRKISKNLYSFETGAYDRANELTIDPLVEVYSKTVAGSDMDMVTELTVDSNAATVIAGYTRSTDFPTKKPVQKINMGQADVFITKINAEGTALVYSTYIGGTENDRAFLLVLSSYLITLQYAYLILYQAPVSIYISGLVYLLGFIYVAATIWFVTSSEEGQGGDYNGVSEVTVAKYNIQ